MAPIHVCSPTPSPQAAKNSHPAKQLTPSPFPPGHRCRCLSSVQRFKNPRHYSHSFHIEPPKLAYSFKKQNQKNLRWGLEWCLRAISVASLTRWQGVCTACQSLWGPQSRTGRGSGGCEARNVLLKPPRRMLPRLQRVSPVIIQLSRIPGSYSPPGSPARGSICRYIG